MIRLLIYFNKSKKILASLFIMITISSAIGLGNLYHNMILYFTMFVIGLGYLFLLSLLLELKEKIGFFDIFMMMYVYLQIGMLGNFYFHFYLYFFSTIIYLGIVISVSILGLFIGRLINKKYGNI